MLQPAQALRNRLSTRSGSAGLVITLVVALLGAPASSALRNECALCPRTCPMHRDREPGHAKRPPRHCHAAPAGAHAPRPAAPEGGLVVGRAACGNHGLMPGTALPPVILHAAHRLPSLAATHAAPGLDGLWQDRLADPPETPPPIAAA